MEIDNNDHCKIDFLPIIFNWHPILCLKKSKLPCQKESKGTSNICWMHIISWTRIIWWTSIINFLPSDGQDTHHMMKTYHMMGTHHKIPANWQKDRIPSYSFKKWWNSIINPEINSSMKFSLSEAFLTCLEYCFWYGSFVMSK